MFAFHSSQIAAIEQSSPIMTQFPSLELVESSLDSLDLLTSEAETTDVVLQMADEDHRYFCVDQRPRRGQKG